MPGVRRRLRGSRTASEIPGWVRALILGLGVLLAPSLLDADGGTLRVANVPMGAYRINVFTDPTPIPPDSIDVSVLATFERGRGVAMGLQIMVEAVRMDGSGLTVRQAATREQADDPRYYAAEFALGRVGMWNITVSVEGPEGQGQVSFEVEVQNPGVLDNPYLILVLAFLPLLLVAIWLKKSKEPPEQGSAPAAPDS